MHNSYSEAVVGNEIIVQSYGLRDEAVLEPGGAGPGAVVLSAVQQQAERSVAGIVGVFNDLVGLLPTLLDVEILHGWQLRPSHVLCSFQHPV